MSQYRIPRRSDQAAPPPAPAPLSARSTVVASLLAVSRPRREEVLPGQTLLLRASTARIRAPYEISPVSRDALERDILPTIVQRDLSGVPYCRRGAMRAYFVFKSQRPDVPTRMVGGSTDTATLMPGGVPVLDLFEMYLRYSMGWAPLLPTVRQFQKERCPSVDGVSSVQVQEITLGSATVNDYEEMISWLHLRQAKAVTDNGCFLPALDTEQLSIQPSASVSSWAGVLDELQLSDTPRFQSYRSGSGILFPVVMMYGGPGFQLHIRLDLIYCSVDGVSGFEIRRGEIPREFGQLMATLQTAVGQGVVQDFEQFFQVIHALYGWQSSSLPPRPVELQRLSMLAGSACPTGLATTCLTWLGGLLCKTRDSSTGDGRWGDSYHRLPRGLKAYMEGHIQSVTRVAWLMVAVWVTHIFPDFHIVSSVTGFQPLAFLHHWEDEVVKRLLVAPANWSRPVFGNHANRTELLLHAGIPSGPEFDLLRLSPGWPALTSGAARDIHSAGAFLYRIYPALRSHHKAWIALTRGEMEKRFLLNRPLETVAAPSSAPADTLRLVAHPSARYELDKLDYRAFTRSLIRKVATSSATFPRDVLLHYAKLNPERGERMLEFWEASPDQLHNLVGLNKSPKVATDLRRLLLSLGRSLPRPDDWADPFQLEVVASIKKARAVDHLQRAIERDETSVATLTAAIEKRKRSLEAALGEPALQDLPNTHLIMRGMAPGDDKILLGDHSEAKRPRLAPAASRSKAARRRARKRQQNQAEVTTAHPSTLAKPAEPPGKSPDDPVSSPEPAPRPRPSFAMLVDLALDDSSDGDGSTYDIGSPGEPKRRVIEYWEGSPPASPSSPPACVSPNPASPTPPSVPASPTSVPALPSSESEDELALSIPADDMFSDSEMASTPPRKVEGYDPQAWRPSGVAMTRAERLSRLTRLFATPSPKR